MQKMATLLTEPLELRRNNVKWIGAWSVCKFRNEIDLVDAICKKKKYP